MADHLFPETRQRARKRHRCIWCYHQITAGEQYVQQESFWDGAPQRNRYHAECWDDLLAQGPHFEFTPGCADPPERIMAQQEQSK